MQTDSPKPSPQAPDAQKAPLASAEEIERAMACLPAIQAMLLAFGVPVRFDDISFSFEERQIYSQRLVRVGTYRIKGNLSGLRAVQRAAIEKFVTIAFDRIGGSARVRFIMTDGLH